MNAAPPALISRVDAKAAGITHYFTGVPCVHGHVEKRSVRHCNCLGCGSEKYRKDRGPQVPKSPTLTETHGAECRRLVADGLTRTDVAKRLGVSRHTVNYAIADETERARLRVQKRHKKKRQRDCGANAPHRAAPPRKARDIPKPISGDIRAAALSAYLAGDIDRHEMGLWLTPDRPRLSPNLYRPIWASVEERCDEA